ncbi:MAG: hypothetical protein M3Y81_04265, partial [Chloroflexota bacterium]|nr:hypothetical protein [Chloroflexota bacterium]
ENSYGYKAQYDGLISLLGFTPDTVVLAYQFIKPKTLVVLHTKETEKFLDNVVNLAHIPIADFFHEPFFETPYSDIYRALESALKRFSKDSRIAIELTGGKKTMGGALAVAAGMLNIDLLYIDYKVYMPEFRKPMPNSTYIHLVGNPMKLSTDLFGSIEIQRAVEFFNQGNYDSSKALFEDIGYRMATPRAIEFCTILSHFYLLWSNFNFKEAFKQTSLLSERVGRFQDQILSRFSFNLEQLQKQFKGIRDLANGDRQAIMWNFYFGALRCQNNSQHDLAALLYYRVIEDVFDNALRDIKEEFDRSKPDYSLFDMPVEDLKSNYQKFRDKVLKKGEAKESLPNPIAMFDAFCILGALGAQLTDQFNARKIMNISSIRNLSVYAHGLSPMDIEALNNIRELATEIIQIYAETKGFDSREAQQDRFQFMRLSMRGV